MSKTLRGWFANLRCVKIGRWRGEGDVLLAVALLVLSLVAPRAHAQDCAGSNTDVCDPSAATDRCFDDGAGIWRCLTIAAGETQASDTVTIYDAGGAVCGTPDSYVTYGVDALGYDFCCFREAAPIGFVPITTVWVNTSTRADTIALRDSTLGIELQQGSPGFLHAYVSAGSGNDTIFGSDYPGTAIDYIEDLGGNNGNDYIDAHAGDDTVNGGQNDDTCYGGVGVDTMYGGLGNDRLHGDGGMDNLYGEGGSDTINGGDDADYIDGGADRDFIDGDGAGDTIYGGALNDSICGDTTTGPTYADTIYAGTGNDVVWGNDPTDGGSCEGGTDLYGSNTTGLAACETMYFVRQTTCP